MTDTNALKGFMVSKGITLDKLSELTGINRASLSYKINNKVEFKTSEVKAVQDALCIDNKERDAVFFADNVD